MFRSWRSVTVLVLSFVAAARAANADEDVLFRYRHAPISDGAYGPVARFQVALENALRKCGRAIVLEPRGYFGPKTQDAVKLAVTCPDVAAKLSRNSKAAAGVLTTDLWAVMMDAPAPTASDRAQALVQTFEGTDYADAQWNFCQSKPAYDPQHGQPKCYSNDRPSYLTWGPRGATAGGGREIQIILDLVEQNNPSAISEAFGDEAKAVRRLLTIPDASEQTKKYLCGVWINPRRRSDWRKGFAVLGSLPGVRQMYDEVYRSSSFDGAKVMTFINAYKVAGYSPSEVDFALFIDRATHMSVDGRALANAIPPPGKRNWEVRRSIALKVRAPGIHEMDRLGRDVAFYVDDVFDSKASLGKDEEKAWANRGMLSASDVGLLDSNVSPPFSAGPRIDRAAPAGTLTKEEEELCPDAVLKSEDPPRAKNSPS